jgi:hypothetical protein
VAWVVIGFNFLESVNDLPVRFQSGIRRRNLRDFLRTFVYFSLDVTTMFSPFVKGLMCATLIRLGVSSVLVLMRASTYHSSLRLLLWYMAGFLALPLAFSLFTRSLLAARLAFGFLLFSALTHIAVPVWATVAKVPPPSSNSGNLFYGFVYLFPCVVAIVTAGHRAKTSNQSLQPTAGRSDV